jgi:hypothetical protein
VLFILGGSVAEPDPGSGAFLPWIRDPVSGKGKKSRSGCGMNFPEHISEGLETIFFVKNTQIL